MSDTDKDQPWRLGGQRRKYYISEKGHAEFTRSSRRRSRAAAKDDLRHDREPSPRYPAEREYFD